MKQNNYTELLGESFNTIYNKNAPPPRPSQTPNPDFSRIFYRKSVVFSAFQSARGLEWHARTRTRTGNRAPRAFLAQSRFPLENPGKSGKIQDLGSGGVCEATSIANFKKTIPQKLCGITLLHFGLVTCRINFGKTRKPSIFMIFGLGGREEETNSF